ncbi:hypothetical protein SESBI_36638 [Sesbania bispinosa]|nr:hypothetical protein SESBI_36638 [Sesbania bispinosa]
MGIMKWGMTMGNIEWGVTMGNDNGKHEMGNDKGQRQWGTYMDNGDEGITGNGQWGWAMRLSNT